MRAERRGSWEQWWLGVGEKELRKVLRNHSYDSRYVIPVIKALRAGTTTQPQLERFLGERRAVFDEAPDEDADGECAMALVLWWDLGRSQRKRFDAT